MVVPHLSVLPEAWKDGGVYEGNGTGSQGNRASLAC